MKSQLDQSCCCKPKGGSEPSAFSSFFSLSLFLFSMVSITFLSSCTNKMAFSYLDTAVAWRLDDYFDLTRDQEKELKKEFIGSTKEIIEKNQKLAREVIAPLKSSEAMPPALVADNADRSQVDCADFEVRLQKVKQIFENSIEVYKAKAVVLTETLKKPQIDYFINATERKILEDEKKSKNAQAFVDKQVDKSIQNVEKFLGSITKEQKEKITTFVKENPRPIIQQIEQQRNNLNKLKELQSDFDKAKNHIKNYISDWKAQQAPDYVQLQNKRLEKQEKFYADLLCRASPEQKKHLLKEVTTVFNDFVDVFSKK